MDSIQSNALLLFIIFLFFLENLKTRTMRLNIEGVPATFLPDKCRSLPISLCLLPSLSTLVGNPPLQMSDGNNGQGRHLDKTPTEIDSADHTLAINVSQIEYWYMCMILQLRQRIDRDGLSSAGVPMVEVKFAPLMLLGCGDLNSFDATNYLDFQLFYLPPSSDLTRGVSTAEKGTELKFERRKSCQDLTRLLSGASNCPHENHIDLFSCIKDRTMGWLCTKGTS